MFYYSNKTIYTSRWIGLSDVYFFPRRYQRGGIVALLEYDLLPFILLMKYHVFMLFLLWKPVGRNSDGKSCLVLWPCFMLFQAYIFPWSKAWHNIYIYSMRLPIQPIITKARQPVLFYSRGGGAVYTACYTTILVQENAPFCGLQLWPTTTSVLWFIFRSDAANFSSN